MRKLKTIAVLKAVSRFSFIVMAAFVFGAMQIVEAEESLSVEGEWEIISVSSETEKGIIGNKVSISRKGDIYEVSGKNEHAGWDWAGNERRIGHTEIELLVDPTAVSEKGGRPASVDHQFAGQRVPINYFFTLSADGNFLTREQDSKTFHWQENTETGEVRNAKYEIEPGEYKRILKRVSVPTKAENRSDRAYKADCGPVDPNRITPITTDLCPGNLVAMTYFCGGGTGCPYVCCPKGLPYLNHCDCKCYATADFECHSYSKAQEQPKQ